ncbi:MAG: hypothetical protein HQK72_05485 [Desulfamplus sp.]|nr:hypothetical protein [Desulfamplus sp.]
MVNLLLLENNLNLRNTFKSIFSKKVAGLKISESSNFTEACSKIVEEEPDLVITNSRIAGKSVYPFVKYLIIHYPNIHIVIISERNIFEYQKFEGNIKKGVVVFADELNIAQIIDKINIFKNLKSPKCLAVRKTLSKQERESQGCELEKRVVLPVSIKKENQVSFAHSLTHSLTHYSLHSIEVNISE